MSRKAARACILCVILGVGTMAAGIILQRLGVVTAGCMPLIAAAVLQLTVLRCPECGLTGIPPQWAKSGTQRCPRCGKPIRYQEAK